MKPIDATVCVVIAAFNAQETIARAVKSALAEPEVKEVVVFDDASRDDTASIALGADDNTGRLTVIRSGVNVGPSVARNKAIEVTSSPLIAILDADDFFIPGRFRRILQKTDWDLIADNIAFVTDTEHVSTLDDNAWLNAEEQFLDVVRFVEGNLPNRRFSRGQLGFLKPVVSREFLSRNGLSYNETMRLGEDYDLYLRSLIAGGRFKLLTSCGYCAVVRHNSLSSRHTTEDLENLYLADVAILENPTISEELRPVLRHHAAHIRSRFEHRRFLDLKRANGIAAAAGFISSSPRRFVEVSSAIVRDKLRNARGNSLKSHAGIEFLIPLDGSR